MALHQRRESVGRTRFLLALSLSTVTAIGVAAPLAIQAVNAGEPTFASGDPNQVGGPGSGGEDLLGAPSDRSLRSGAGGIGGIEARSPAKGQSQTTKSENADSEPTQPDPGTEDSVLTNPEDPGTPPDPTVVEPPVDETTTTTVIEPTTSAPSTTEAPVTTPTSDPVTTPTTTASSTTTTTGSSSTTTSDTAPETTSSSTTTNTPPTP